MTYGVKIYRKRGFTLIELLVVIAIIAVISVVVILTLNPAELLRQARDSNRTSDLATLKSSLSLYLADVATPSIGAATTCYQTVINGNATNGGHCGASWFLNSTAVTSSTSRAVNGNGWMPVNFTAMSSGAPIAQLPIDPINNSSFMYAYIGVTASSTFEVDAAMESNKYASSSNNIVNNDGGSNPSVYEVGTQPGLNL